MLLNEILESVLRNFLVLTVLHEHLLLTFIKATLHLKSLSAWLCVSRAYVRSQGLYIFPSTLGKLKLRLLLVLYRKCFFNPPHLLTSPDYMGFNINLNSDSILFYLDSKFIIRLEIKGVEWRKR